MSFIDDDDFTDYETERFEEEYGAEIDAMCEDIMAEDAQPAIINLKRTYDVKNLYERVQEMAKDMPGVKISEKLNAPFKTLGSVHLEGKTIVFKNPKDFVNALDIANNVEVYPKTNGTVHLAYGISGLVTYIGEGE